MPQARRVPLRDKNLCRFLDTGSNITIMRTSIFAGIAQLVERNLAKVEVASSSLVSRSTFLGKYLAFPLFLKACATWRGGRVVMQRPAKPCTPVRFRPPPPSSSVLSSNFYPWIFLLCYNSPLRGVAQPGSVLGWGPSGRRFESSRPDQLNKRLAD